MIAARAQSLTPFFIVYKQEALLPATTMAVDMIFTHSWDSIYKEEWFFTEELVAMLRGQKPKIAERL